MPKLKKFIYLGATKESTGRGVKFDAKRMKKVLGDDIDFACLDKLPERIKRAKEVGVSPDAEMLSHAVMMALGLYRDIDDTYSASDYAEYLARPKMVPADRGEIECAVRREIAVIIARGIAKYRPSDEAKTAISYAVQIAGRSQTKRRKVNALGLVMIAKLNGVLGEIKAPVLAP